MEKWKRHEATAEEHQVWLKKPEIHVRFEPAVEKPVILAARIPGVNLLGGLRLLITQEFGFFLEGKYNRATITNLDPTFGLTGEYSVFHGVAGLSCHF